MSLLARFNRPFRGARLLSRVVVELRGIRRALERQADMLELSMGQAPRPGVQSFRGFSRLRAEAEGQGDPRGTTGVSYVDPVALGTLLGVEEELAGLLGRQPTEDELGRALAERDL